MPNPTFSLVMHSGSLLLNLSISSNFKRQKTKRESIPRNNDSRPTNRNVIVFYFLFCGWWFVASFGLTEKVTLCGLNHAIADDKKCSVINTMSGFK